MNIYTAYIAVGSNLGDRLSNCQKGISELTKKTNSQLIRLSDFYQTQPMYIEDQDWFINGVFSIQTKYSPHELFHSIKETEILLGRDLTAKRYGPRVLDLDILMMDNLIINTQNLNIPHPRLHERRFVLQPLSDIAAEIVHPILNKNIKELLIDLNDDQKVYRYK